MSITSNLSNSKRAKALLFDLDGTLVDTATDLAAAMNHVLQKYNYPTLPLANVRDLVGHGAAYLLARGMFGKDAKPPQNDPQFKEAIKLFLSFYTEHLLDNSTPFPGVVAALEKFKKAGFKLAVVTNKPIDLTTKMLDGLDLDHFFSIVVGGDSLPEKKPDPQPLLFALAKMNTTIDNCMMVGDSDNDILAAQNAGCHSVAVTYGYHGNRPLAELGPTHIINHFVELENIINLDAP